MLTSPLAKICSAPRAMWRHLEVTCKIVLSIGSVTTYFTIFLLNIEPTSYFGLGVL